MNFCKSCLKEGFETFCTQCRKKLFNGRSISNILTFTHTEFNEIRLNQGDRLSISGIQIKHSLKLGKNSLVLTNRGGEYILKPTPIGTVKNLKYTPANEHLTMQIAEQIFDIKTAPNAYMQFKDNEPAYIVKRFDVMANGEKLLQEDFAQVAGRSEENFGKNYKYDFSYEEIADLMKKYISAYPIEIEKFFKLLIFNYLVCNGDAHLKNFSVFRNIEFRDYTLTPAYDLLNTSLHISNEKDTALELFKDDFMTESFRYGSKYAKDDFYEFGIRIGIVESRVKKIYEGFLDKEEGIKILIEKSFLPEELKEMYLESVLSRVNRLKYSYRDEK